MKMKTFLGALLVGGTALGAGMLALPVATAGAGLIPSWTVYFLTWLFSIATGLLFVEIGLWLPRNANIVSMAKTLLGNPGKWAAWGLYIFLFYSLTVAYVSGGGRFVATFLGLESKVELGILLFALIFGLVVYLGTRIAGKVNAILMGGLIFSYLGFTIFGVEKINLSMINLFGWKSAILGFPVIFTSFSYQGTIPTLLDYLKRDLKKTKTAIIAGTSIPFFAYIIWDLIIKGIIPVDGAHGLIAAKEAGMSAVEPLKYFLSNSKIATVGSFFAFFALTTSFIGVTLGLMDFLMDSLNLERGFVNKSLLALLVFVPPTIIALINPAIFITALGYAGGFGCALLLGLMPVWMVWVGRYKKKFPNQIVVLPGKKPVLLLLLAFVGFEVVVQLSKIVF
jgi:tyrosine-specific transport protein